MQVDPVCKTAVESLSFPFSALYCSKMQGTAVNSPHDKESSKTPHVSFKYRISKKQTLQVCSTHISKEVNFEDFWQ